MKWRLCVEHPSSESGPFNLFVRSRRVTPNEPRMGPATTRLASLYLRGNHVDGLRNNIRPTDYIVGNSILVVNSRLGTIPLLISVQARCQSWAKVFPAFLGHEVGRVHRNVVKRKRGGRVLEQWTLTGFKPGLN